MAKGKSGLTRKAEMRKPEYFGETEKAVSLKLMVTDVDLEQTRTRTVWVPKSQLAEDGKPSMWITGQKAQEFYSYGRSSGNIEAMWEDAAGNRFSASFTEREIANAKNRAARISAGVSSYNSLIEHAKELGIKGIRKGMKRSTIEEKIKRHKK